MVALDTARTAVAQLVSSHSLVAVFVGGTSGIGEYTLRALAQHASSNDQGVGLRVYLVGRNVTAADNILADCRKLCPRGRFTFVKAENLAVLKDVDRCCDEILKLEREQVDGAVRIDMLVMSQSLLGFDPWTDTGEGLDMTMSLIYYSRMRFIIQLMPLLRASTLPAGARCISVYAAGLEMRKLFYPDDFPLKIPGHFSFFKVRSQVLYMKTLFFERVARENEGKVALVHIRPSLTITPSFYSKTNPWFFKLAWFILGPLARAYALPPEAMGQRVLYLATERYPARSTSTTAGGTSSHATGSPVAAGSDGTRGGGAYSVKAGGETNNLVKAYADLDRGTMTEKVWRHTMSVFEGIEGGKQ